MDVKRKYVCLHIYLRFYRQTHGANKSRAARLEMFAPGDNPTAANATRMLAYRQGFWQIDLCSKQIEAR